MDPTGQESVTAVVDIPSDWTSMNAYMYWTTPVAPGGLGGGVVAWDMNVGNSRSIIGDVTPTVDPVGLSAPATGFASGTRISETVPASGELGFLRRRQALAGTANAYPAIRGLHELQISRAANSGSDTLPVDAVFLGVLYERVE